MDAGQFIDLVRRLAPPPNEGFARGAALRLVDDQLLAWGERSAADVIVAGLPVDAGDASAWLLANAEELISGYYRLHPLTRAGFDLQARRLITDLGPAAFAAPAGQLPHCTLFVDGGELVAEPRGAARHRYGAYLELGRELAPVAIERAVEQWIASGEAYDRYLSMNVCRYNC